MESAPHPDEYSALADNNVFTNLLAARNLGFAVGMHLAALGGAWLAVVAGFGVLRDHGATLEFAPRLPVALQRLRFFRVPRSSGRARNHSS